MTHFHQTGFGGMPIEMMVSPARSFEGSATSMVAASTFVTPAAADTERVSYVLKPLERRTGGQRVPGQGHRPVQSHQNVSSEIEDLYQTKLRFRSYRPGERLKFTICLGVILGTLPSAALIVFCLFTIPRSRTRRPRHKDPHSYRRTSCSPACAIVRE